MREITVYCYDAFTTVPNMGNPAGVVLDCDELTTEQMQEIAKLANYSETAFIRKSADPEADYELRFFSPGKEMQLCGHATVASIYCMQSKGLLAKKELMIKTLAGVLPITIIGTDKEFRISMGHAKPQFKPFNGDIGALAKSIGIDINDIDPSMPIVYGSTGTWTLLVPVKGLEICKKMHPDNARFPEILKDIPTCSVHPFCMETINLRRADMHSRHFSTPSSGIIEDAVTGTASGVMVAYYVTYIEPSVTDIELLLEQGQEMGKDGEVYVCARKKGEELHISISGEAVYSAKKTVTIGR